MNLAKPAVQCEAECLEKSVTEANPAYAKMGRMIISQALAEVFRTIE